jgi:hypothetical protein
MGGYPLLPDNRLSQFTLPKGWTPGPFVEHDGQASTTSRAP